MTHPIATVIRKEFRQIFRDPALMRIVLFVPLIQLFIFGYAANTDLHNVRVGILDEDGSRASRDLARACFSSDVFVPGPSARSAAALPRLLMQDEADLTLHIPPGYAESLAQHRPLPVGILVDGRNSSLAGRAAGYANAILARETERPLTEELPGGSVSQGRVHSVRRFFYNPELRSRFYMVPGIVVLIITIISALLTGMAVVREREIGTLEQLMVSPLTPWQLIAGKTLPFAMIGFVDLAVATLLAVLWFRLPFVGSPFLLGGCALVYLLVTLGIGLLASTLSATQQQAMFTLWFFLVFGILMSGFFFPLENMPPILRALTYANPLRYMMTIVRGIFLRGAGFLDLWPQLAALLLLGTLTFTTAVLRFQKRLG